MPYSGQVCALLGEQRITERRSPERVGDGPAPEDAPDLGGIRLLPEPANARQGVADPYSVCAFILRDALASAAALIPELELEGFDAVAGRLDTLRQPSAAGVPEAK